MEKTNQSYHNFLTTAGCLSPSLDQVFERYTLGNHSLSSKRIDFFSSNKGVYVIFNCKLLENILRRLLGF